MRVNRRLATLALTLGLVALPAEPAMAREPLAIPAPASVAVPDFDGDGRADLAFSHASTPDLTVRYGNGTVVQITGTEVLGEEGTLGSAVLARDLNADGYTDLVLGASTYSDYVSRVHVLFGSPAGLQVSSQPSFGIPALNQVVSLALVTAPVPRLAVGLDNSATEGGVGTVAVYDLGPDGLPKSEPAFLTPGSGTVPAAAGTYFAIRLAAWENHLYVGAHYTLVGKVHSGGVLAVDFGPTGVTATKLVTRSTKGVPGKARENDSFGFSVAARDGYLAVGIPGDNIPSIKASGSVQLFRITSSGLVPGRLIWQGTRGVPGTADRYDDFGRSVALGTVCPGVLGVIVGNPEERPPTTDVMAAGAAWVIPLKTKKGCRAIGLRQGKGLPGHPTENYNLGQGVAVIRDRGAKVDLVAISGATTSDPEGRVFLWSPKTRKVIATFTVDGAALAGR